MKRLVDIDRDGIANDGLARAGAGERADPVAETVDEREPSGGVPAADQPVRPFLAQCRLDIVKDGDGGGPQRVAGEIDEPFWHVEARLEVAQRIRYIFLLNGG